MDTSFGSASCNDTSFDSTSYNAPQQRQAEFGIAVPSGTLVCSSQRNSIDVCSIFVQAFLQLLLKVLPSASVIVICMTVCGIPISSTQLDRTYLCFVLFAKISPFRCSGSTCIAACTGDDSR